MLLCRPERELGELPWVQWLKLMLLMSIHYTMGATAVIMAQMQGLSLAAPSSCIYVISMKELYPVGRGTHHVCSKGNATASPTQLVSLVL